MRLMLLYSLKKGLKNNVFLRLPRHGHIFVSTVRAILDVRLLRGTDPCPLILWRAQFPNLTSFNGCHRNGGTAAGENLRAAFERGCRRGGLMDDQLWMRGT